MGRSEGLPPFAKNREGWGTHCLVVRAKAGPRAQTSGFCFILVVLYIVVVATWLVVLARLGFAATHGHHWTLEPLGLQPRVVHLGLPIRIAVIAPDSSIVTPLLSLL